MCPKAVPESLRVKAVKAIPPLFYFSNPWNKNSQSSFTSEYAYQIFVECPAMASGTTAAAYVPVKALVGNETTDAEKKKGEAIQNLYDTFIKVRDRLDC